MELVLVLVLVLVLPRSQAQNLTRVRAELGQNATLTCSLRDADIYWYLEIYRGLRARIGETLSSFSYYSSPDLERKFLMLENNLTIKNVTAEDRRLYFCGQKIIGELVAVESFQLVSDVPSQLQECSWQQQPAVWGSLSLSAVLLLLLTGVLFVCLRRRCSCRRINRTPDPPPESPGRPEAPQYEEIGVPVREQIDCIYYKAQHPLPRL